MWQNVTFESFDTLEVCQMFAERHLFVGWAVAFNRLFIWKERDFFFLSFSFLADLLVERRGGRKLK